MWLRVKGFEVVRDIQVIVLPPEAFEISI